MENTEIQPFDTTPAQVEPNVEPNTDVQNPGDNQAGEPGDQQPQQQQPVASQSGNEVRNNNWNNGKRRIAQRQSAKARIRELEEEVARLKGQTDDYSRFRSEQLQDRINDMRAIDADNEATEFANRAATWFGDDTDKFMQDTYRYAAYVNQNEPDLLRYANREFGLILLHEWYKRMDVPDLRAQWMGMTQFEKGSVLNNLYGQIAKLVEQAKGQPSAQTPPAAKPSIPVPNGGRQSAAQIATDDFGSALQDAFNRVK